MKIVTLASLRGAPGVTTTALLLASTFSDAAVVEADLDGGVLAVRYGLGREPGLTTFAASGGEGGHDDWRAHAQDAGGVPVLVGPDASAASASLWRTAGERITDKLVAADGVAVVDAGRLRSLVPVVSASDLLAVLVCPIAEQLVALTHVLPTLQQTMRGRVAVVLVGDGPYRAADLEGPLDFTVLGELPDDRDAAEALRKGTASSTRLARSRLARGVTALGAEVRTAVFESVEVTVS
jgi:MinD-like ATPase involved in chromosome partitioning or flagellar assembly